MTMLPQAPALIGPHCPRRGSLVAVVALLSLAVFIAGDRLAAPALAQKEDNKKTKQDDLKKGAADKDGTKKTDDDKEIEELVKEMSRNRPDITPAMLQQMREQVRKMPPQQRKNMLSFMQNRNQLGFPGKPQPIGGVMDPRLGWMGQNARLGARVESVSAALAEQLDLPKGQGLVVREVLPDTAASKAGVKLHDVLLEFNGKAVPNRVEDFTRMLADVKPDAAVELVVVRKGKKETIKDVKLPEAKPGQPGLPFGGLPGAGQPPGGFPPPAAGFQQPPNVFQQPPGIGGAASVVTTMVRTQDRFTLRHQEGSLIITLTGQTADGKPKIKEIDVQDGGRFERYDSVDKVPDRYSDKVKNLIEMSEKGSVRIDIKSP
jgi:hypothetical protein